MSDKIKINGFAFTTVLLWASTYVVTRYIGDELSPNVIAFVRCAIAAVLFVCIGLSGRIRRPFYKKDIALFLLSGAMGYVVFLIAINISLLTLTAATSSLIASTSPVFTAIGACIIYRERINVTGWIAITMSFAGVMLLVLWEGGLSINGGIIWALISSLGFSGYNLISRKLTKLGYTSIEIVAYSVICSAILMLPILPRSISELQHTDMAVITFVIYMGVFASGLAYILWAKAMALSNKISSVTNYSFVLPLLSALMGIIALGESLDMGTVIGGMVIIGGMFLYTAKGKGQ